MGTKCYLNIENEALEHISSLILNVFNSILLAKCNAPTPEATCSLAMSSTSDLSISEFSSCSTINTLVSEKGANDGNNGVSLSMSSKSVRVSAIHNLEEAEDRVRIAMPPVYIGELFF